MTAGTRRARALFLVAAALACGACATGGPTLTRDPDVRGAFPGLFMWAVAEPTIAIGEIDPDGVRAEVDRAATLYDDDRAIDFGITVVTAFETARQAEAHAADVREILEDAAAWYADPANADARAVLEDPEQPAALTPPEEAAMNAHNLAAGTRGMGWGGRPGTAGVAVYTLGPIVMITGLKSDALTDVDELAIHPLAHLLAAEGGTVLLEGHHFGEGSITADLSCRPPDSATGRLLLDELGDAIATSGQFNTRPPWVGPPPTEAEALARATYRRWTDGMFAAFDEDWAHDLLGRLNESSTADEIQAVTHELELRMAERGLQRIEGELDPATLALLANPPGVGSEAAHNKWVLDLGQRMGSVRLHSTEYGPRPHRADYERQANTASVRLNGDRLEFGWLMFGRFAAGLPYLAAYLREQGCEDLKVGIVDFDEVRGD